MCFEVSEMQIAKCGAYFEILHFKRLVMTAKLFTTNCIIHYVQSPQS